MLMKNLYGDDPWTHLPFPGGWTDQPDWWMHDLPILQWRYRLKKEQIGVASNPGV
jgi:hypothetical protein